MDRRCGALLPIFRLVGVPCIARLVESEEPAASKRQERMSAVLEVRTLNVVMGYHALSQQRALAWRGSGGARREPNRASATRALAGLSSLGLPSSTSRRTLALAGLSVPATSENQARLCPCRLAASRGML
jgi:hypothetical protein